MSKRSQGSVLKTLNFAVAYGDKVTFTRLAELHGLPASEMRRLVDAMAKNGKLTWDGIYLVPGSKTEKPVKDEPVLEVARKQYTPSVAMALYPGPQSDDQETTIKKEFERRHGYEPTTIEWTGSAYLVGPVTDVRLGEV